MVARFVRAKGQDVAVEALRILDDPALRLFLIGKAEGEWFRGISGLVDRYGLERQVTFLGHREDVMDILQGMDIYLAPSRREGLPLSILEALSSTLPVVATVL